MPRYTDPNELPPGHLRRLHREQQRAIRKEREEREEQIQDEGGARTLKQLVKREREADGPPRP
jgi:hypothetical protein